MKAITSEWWIYWVGPVIGAFAASLSFSFLAKRISEAQAVPFWK